MENSIVNQWWERVFFPIHLISVGRLWERDRKRSFSARNRVCSGNEQVIVEGSVRTAPWGPGRSWALSSTDTPGIYLTHFNCTNSESIRIWVTSERNFARPPGCILWRYKACSMFLLLVKSFYNPMEDWLAGVDEMGWEYLIFPQVLGEYKSNEVKKLMMGLTRWDTFNLPGLSFGNNIEHKRELHWI